MPEDFSDGPAVGGGFPLKEVLGKVTQKEFQQGGSFFEKGNRSLNGDNRNRLHRGPHRITLSASVQEFRRGRVRPRYFFRKGEEEWDEW